MTVSEITSPLAPTRAGQPMNAAALETPASAEPVRKSARNGEGDVVQPALGEMTEAAFNASTNYLDSARAVLDMLIITYGGEIEKEKRLQDSLMFGLYVFMADCLNRVKDLTFQVNDELARVCFNALAIAETLENIISNYNLEVPFGDATMDGIFRALTIAMDDLEISLKEANV
ncbi:MAG: hypothetical protein V4451_17070 [Pseudomonadota bacterium]